MKREKTIKKNILLYLDRLFIFYSIIFFIFSMFFFYKKDYSFYILPYIGESILYVILKLLLKIDIKRLIRIFAIVNSLFIFFHIFIAVLFVNFIIIDYLTLFYGLILVTSVFSFYVTYKVDKFSISFILYIVLIVTYAFFSRSLFNIYQKYKWISTCVKISKNTNSQLGISKKKTKEHCVCIYEKLVKRYKNASAFPVNERDYAKEDKIDAYNCTVDILVTDSIDKELMRARMNDYIDN